MGFRTKNSIVKTGSEIFSIQFNLKNIFEITPEVYCLVLTEIICSCRILIAQPTSVKNIKRSQNDELGEVVPLEEGRGSEEQATRHMPSYLPCLPRPSPTPQLLLICHLNR